MLLSESWFVPVLEQHLCAWEYCVFVEGLEPQVERMFSLHLQIRHVWLIKKHLYPGYFVFIQCSLKFKKKKKKHFSFWLRWVFIAALGLSLVAVRRLLIVAASLVAEHRL